MVITVSALALVSAYYTYNKTVIILETFLVDFLGMQKDSLDQRLLGLDDINLQIILNERVLSLVETKQSTGDFMLTVNMVSRFLGNLIDSNDAVDNIYLFGRDDSFFIEQCLRDKREFELDVNSIYSLPKSPSFILDETTGKLYYVTVINPLPAFRSQWYIVIKADINRFFHLNEAFSENLRDISFFVLWDNDIIYGNDPELIRHQDTISAMLPYDYDSESNGKLMLEESTYAYFLRKSSQQKFSYAVLRDYSSLIQPASIMTTAIMLAALLILPFSAFIIYLSVSRMHRPLKMLIYKVQDITNNSSYADEYYFISQTIERLKLDNRRLSRYLFMEDEDSDEIDFDHKDVLKPVLEAVNVNDYQGALHALEAYMNTLPCKQALDSQFVRFEL